MIFEFHQFFGKATDEVATLRSEFVGPDFLLHVKPHCCQALGDGKRTVESSTNMLRCGRPPKLPPLLKFGSRDESFAVIEKIDK